MFEVVHVLRGMGRRWFKALSPSVLHTGKNMQLHTNQDTERSTSYPVLPSKRGLSSASSADTYACTAIEAEQDELQP